VKFPRDTSEGHFPAPGTWRPGSSDGCPTAFLRCPKCPTYGALAGTHQIDAAGAVTPSVVCPGRSCDFHEFVQLEGWPA
jgi:hypothetical protein